jgi:hypothetical protein
MKRNVLKIGIPGLALVLSTFLSGCVTAIPVTVTKPPRIDTSGIKRLAVMPFKAQQTAQADIAAALTSKTREIITGIGQFTMVSPDAVIPLQRSNGDVSSVTDGIFTGEVTSFQVNNTSRQVKYTEKVNGQKVERTRPEYTREVTLEFTYSLVQARDNSILDTITRSGKAKASAASSGGLMSALDLGRSIVDTQLRALAQDIAPWQVTERRTLAKESSKDKVIKQRMKEADALVKAKSYRQALAAYDAIYESTQSFAAAYNGAIITEILGDMNGAISRMAALGQATGNPGATSELARMRRTLADTNTVATKFTGDDPTDKVAGEITDTIRPLLPPNTTVSILNISNTNSDRVEYITGKITDAITQTGAVKLVDRQSYAMIEMEKNLQLSGAVDDNSIVSIGHELGVNIIITVRMSGSGQYRQMRVQMVNVETAQVLFTKSWDV